MPNVRRTQSIATVTATYARTMQDSLSLDVPVVNSQFGVSALAGGPVDPTRTSGVGDIFLTYRRWLTPVPYFPDSSPGWRHNVSVGIGLKLPTGNTNAQDRSADITGAARILRDMDITSQPGDGGVGVLVDAQGFRSLGKSTLFFSAAYLISPRDTNGTLSLTSNLFGAANVPRRVRHNSVPDQFSALVGIAKPIRRMRGLSGSLALRVAGVPPSDLIGGSDGFRFAGYGIAIEPGLSYSRGPNTLQVSAPVVLHRRAFDTDIVPGRDFVSFAPFQVTLQLTHRFGKGGKGGASRTKRAAPHDDAPPEPARERPDANPPCIPVSATPPCMLEWENDLALPAAAGCNGSPCAAWCGDNGDTGYLEAGDRNE